MQQPEAKQKRKRVRVTLAVRAAVADALDPGEVERQFGEVRPLVLTAVYRTFRRRSEVIGLEHALQEGYIGAYAGLIEWVLRGGPVGLAGRPSTFVYASIRFRFKRLMQRPALMLRYWSLSTDGETDFRAIKAFVHPDPRTKLDRHAHLRVRAEQVLAAADAVDPTGWTRRVLAMYGGLDGGPGMSFDEIAGVLGVTKQAVQQRIGRFKWRIAAALPEHVKTFT